MTTIQPTLLERLRHPGPPGERRMRASNREIVDSILVNLQKMLNTTQGNCLTDLEYGLPHLTTVQSEMPVSVRGFLSALKGSLERCEPRLKSVRVRHVPSRDTRMELRFEISGLIMGDDERTAVRFETCLTDDGKMEIR